MIPDWREADGLAFDMDGTLWDAVDSYCAVWNRCFVEIGAERRIERQELVECMGMQLIDILHLLTKECPVGDDEAFLQLVAQREVEMMPQLGGKAYAGVKEGIHRLSEHYPVFLLSNCGVDGLNVMMDCVGIRQYISEAVTYGATKVSKCDNLLAIARRNHLQRLVYVGDTDGDCRQTHAAGLPFVFASWGFGNCDDADLRVDSFQQLTDIFINLKKNEK